MKLLPITDLHCDLLLYLSHFKGAHIEGTEDIGVTLPFLKKGNVKHQITAVFTPTKKGSVAMANKQFDCFKTLVESSDFHNHTSPEANAKDTIGITLAIENASGICNESEPIQNAFQRLDKIRDTYQRIFYISFTHHPENRFGGGNYAPGIGLKEDGERMLDYMDGQQIAIDLSHTSDALAIDILNYIDQNNLKIPVIASHSNFRIIWDHPRNLPEELVQEVIRREGLIGMNFLRAFIHPTDPGVLLEHIQMGLEKAEDQVAFGADFFYRKGILDPERHPLFFEEHEDAGKYPNIIQQLTEKGMDHIQIEKLAYQNVLNFMAKNWG